MPILSDAMFECLFGYMGDSIALGFLPYIDLGDSVS